MIIENGELRINLMAGKRIKDEERKDLKKRNELVPKINQIGTLFFIGNKKEEPIISIGGCRMQPESDGHQMSQLNRCSLSNNHELQRQFIIVCKNLLSDIMTRMASHGSGSPNIARTSGFQEIKFLE